MDAYAPPHPALRGLVRGRYHAGWEILARGETVVVPASLSLSLNVNCGEEPPGSPAAYAAGPGLLYRYGGEAQGPTLVEWVGVRLTPLGAYRLVGGPLSQTSGRIADLNDLFGTPGRILAERCRAARSQQERFVLIDEFLLHRFAEGPEPSPETVRAWRLLSSSTGQLRVGELAADAGWSTDHFGKVFRRQTGLSPKTAARLIRLHTLLRCAARQSVGWPRLAAEHGYSDQPHFNRDMREFTGMTPSAYFARLRPCGCLSAPPRPEANPAAGSDSFKTAMPSLS
ncbi:helix-turn-helix domain-containing protein [Streptomyces longwoodensis]|uniref:helix-turn-helix domain-containing protein n=1 Tax=Streptomyces longwoodensis TaxID=68231 RepID=UPI0033ED6E99